MWPFNIIGRVGYAEYQDIRDLADPGTPFRRHTMMILLDKLREKHQTVDVVVSNVPHDRFDRISWDFYYLPEYYLPEQSRSWRAYVGKITYHAKEVVYTVNIRVANVAYPFPYNDEMLYPLWVKLTGTDGTNIVIEQCYVIEVGVKSTDKEFEKEILVSDLLSGFADVASSILWRRPLLTRVVHGGESK